MNQDKKQKFENLKLQIENQIDKFQVNNDNNLNKSHIRFSINSLSKKFVSEKQLKKKLQEKFGNLDFQSTLDKMKSIGFLNDQKLTEIECRNLSSRKFYSNRRIKNHLIQKGLPDYMIEECLENSSDEFERSMNLLKKKYKIKAKNQVVKASRFLFSYGYSTSTIKKAIKEYFGDLEE